MNIIQEQTECLRKLLTNQELHENYLCNEDRLTQLRLDCHKFEDQLRAWSRYFERFYEVIPEISIEVMVGIDWEDIPFGEPVVKLDINRDALSVAKKS